ncbi:MAG: hypothetical protein H6729_12185 [Deltaproteobacteria bacterium]|nr:hypothetical protein [Deltaproteobacteria bacterium]
MRIHKLFEADEKLGVLVLDPLAPRSWAAHTIDVFEFDALFDLANRSAVSSVATHKT